MSGAACSPLPAISVQLHLGPKRAARVPRDSTRTRCKLPAPMAVRTPGHAAFGAITQSSPGARHAHKLISTRFSCSTPTLFYRIYPLPILSHLLFCCLWPLGFRLSLHVLLSRWCHRCRCRRSLCTCSSPAGVRRYYHRRILCTRSSAGSIARAIDNNLQPALDRAGVLRGFLAAEGCSARAVARPDKLSGSIPRSSCLWRFPCGPQGTCPSSILFLPAGSLRAISVIRHPLWHVLHIKTFGAVGAVLHSRECPCVCVLFRST